MVGAGAFGKNNLRVYSELRREAGVKLCAVVDAIRWRWPQLRLSMGFRVCVGDGVPCCFSGDEKLDAASVCVPTVHHAAVAEELLAAGVDVLIEKPIAASLEEATGLLRWRRSSDASCRWDIWNGLTRR